MSVTGERYSLHQHLSIRRTRHYWNDCSENLKYVCPTAFLFMDELFFRILVVTGFRRESVSNPEMSTQELAESYFLFAVSKGPFGKDRQRVNVASVDHDIEAVVLNHTRVQTPLHKLPSISRLSARSSAQLTFLWHANVEGRPHGTRDRARTPSLAHVTKRRAYRKHLKHDSEPSSR